MYRDRAGDYLCAAVRRRGIKMGDFLKMAQIPKPRFYRHAKDTDKITLEELRAMDKALRFTSEELMELLRG